MPYRMLQRGDKERSTSEVEERIHPPHYVRCSALSMMGGDRNIPTEERITDCSSYFRGIVRRLTPSIS